MRTGALWIMTLTDLQKALDSKQDDPMFGNPLVALPA